jgi:hypothetical protein
LERHPEKTYLRNQLVTYLIGSSELTRGELESLISSILSPPLKKEVMFQGESFWAVAARETEERVRKEEREAAEKMRKEEREAAEKMHKEERALALRILGGLKRI